MNDKEKNIFDKFLDHYEKTTKNQKVSVKVFQKPSKLKSIIGFSFSLLLFFVLIRMFVFKLLFFIILLCDLGICFFYGINLFTKKGIRLPKHVLINKKDYDKGLENYNKDR